MSLEAGLGAGKEIETNTESRLLRDFIEENWPEENPYIANLPVKNKIDFGTTMDRTKKIATLNTYRVFSNVIDKDIGSFTYMFNVPVAIDVFVRDTKAQAQRREPTQLVAIEMYLRDFITNNRLGLRNKGINNFKYVSSEFVGEPLDDGKDTNIYHLVVTVRVFYHMHKTL